MSRQARKRLNIGAALIMIGVAFVAIISLIGPTAAPPAFAQTAGPADAIRLNPAVRLIQLGFDARTLAAGGANATIANKVLSYLAARPEDLENLTGLETAMGHAEGVEMEVRSKLREGGATPERLAGLEAAKTALAAHRVKRATAEGALRAGLLDLLASQIGADGIVIGERFRTNHLWLTPNRFKALDLSNGEWHTLQRACLKQSVEQELNTQEATLLAECEYDPLSALVASRLMVSESSISAAIDGAIVAAY